MEQQPQAANKGGKNNSLTIIVAIIVALVVGVSVYFITRGDSSKSDGDKKKVMSFQEMNRKIAKLEFIKVDTAAFDLKADKMMNNSDVIWNL